MHPGPVNGIEAPNEIEASGGSVHWLDGGVRLRAASWPGSGAGTVLLLHGRTEFIERCWRRRWSTSCTRAA